MERSRVNKLDKRQAVRLPKPLALPAGEAWGSWFGGGRVTRDFMSKREQTMPQTRKGF